MDEQMTPEEKLLKHIRQKNNAPASKRAARRKEEDLDEEGQAEKKERDFLPAFNRVLVVIIILALSYIVYAFITNDRNMVDIKKNLTRSPSNESVGMKLKEPKPFAFYAKKIDSRDIFQSPYERNDNQAQKPTISLVPDLTSNLKLVGIILGDTKEAVVEDLGERRTLFLKEGEAVRGASVEEILESKIILRYQDQRIEITQ